MRFLLASDLFIMVPTAIGALQRAAPVALKAPSDHIILLQIGM